MDVSLKMKIGISMYPFMSISDCQNSGQNCNMRIILIYLKAPILVAAVIS
jgi:hypothetical protein